MIRALTRVPELSGSLRIHSFLMLPDFKSLWWGFSLTSSHLLKCADNGTWRAGTGTEYAL